MVIKLLLIDDSVDDADLIVNELEDAGFDLIYELVSNRKDLEKALRKEWDFVIADYAMPGFSGIEALKLIRDHKKNLPFILVSGTVGEEIAVEAMKAGAQDYIMKDKLTRLGPAVMREIQEAKIKEERVSALQSLAESEAKIRSFFISAPIGIGIVNNREIQYFNDRLCEIVGYSREELSGKNSRLLYVNDEEYNRVADEEYPVLLKEGIVTYKTKYRRKDGKIINVLINSSPIDINDSSKGFTFTIQDITEQVNHEKLTEVLYKISNAVNAVENIHELAGNIKKELAQIIDTTNFYIALYHKENDTLSLPFFIDEKDKFNHIPAGKTLTKYVIQKQKAQLLRYPEVEQLIKKGIVERVASPSKCWLGIPLKNDGEIIGVLGVQNYVDENAFSEEDLKILEIISEQIATSIKLILAKNNLKDSENRFRVLANATDQAVFILKKGYCIDTNDRATEMFGYSYEEMVGKYGIHLIAPESKKLVENYMLSGFSKPYEGVGCRKDGTTFPALFHGRMFDYNGEQVRLTTVLDLTREKENEKEILKAKEQAEESDKLKTAFLANMSHEIRTPMNGIIGFSEMFLQPELEKESRIEYAKIVIESSHQLLTIVNDILDISRIEAGQVKVQNETVNIKEIAQDLFTFFKPKANEKLLEFVCLDNCKDQCSTISTDKTKLKQILNNLLSNSLKFTDKGHVKFGFKINNKDITFFVEDTGIGIPEDLHDKIFERFRQAELELTRQYGGTGLGLSITKKLVELMEGRIWLNSEVGKGSTFYFTIPYLPIEDEKENAKSKEEEVIVTHEGTILVAEDEQLNYLFIYEILRKNNYSIIHAVDGRDAVNKFNEHPEINLILMDLKMPVLSGNEAAVEIKKIKPDLPIIAQTAFAMPEDREIALNSGFDEYISKPIKKEQLLKLIDSFLVERIK